MDKNRRITPTDCARRRPTQKKTHSPWARGCGFSPELPLGTASSVNGSLPAYGICHYLTRSEKDVFIEWRQQLRDTAAKIAVDRRINRMEPGNFGDRKFCRDGAWELRTDVGPGLRV
jgi:hypothetical protein